MMPWARLFGLRVLVLAMALTAVLSATVPYAPAQAQTQITMSWFVEETTTSEAASNKVAVGLRMDPPPSQDFYLPVEYIDQTATEGEDYRGSYPECGAGTRSCVILLTLLDDKLHEGTESFRIQIRVGTLPSWINMSGSLFHNVRIVDDDPPPSKPTVTISGGSAVTEGQTALFQLKGSPANSRLPVTVNVTVSQNGDFAAHGQTGPRQVTIPSSGTVSLGVSTVNDNLDEEDGWVRVVVGQSSDYTVGSPPATVAVEDNDEPPPPEPVVEFFRGGDTRGEDFGTHNVVVNLSRAAESDLTINYSVGGTATRDSDYTIAGSDTVVVPTGTSTTTIQVTIIDDALHEGDETVVLTLAAGTGYREGVQPYSLTITDNDPPPPPAVQFLSSSASVGEEAGAFAFALALTRAAPSDLTINYSVGGTATKDRDYRPNPVTFLEGESSTILRGTIIDDALHEGDETVVLTLTGGTGYTVGRPNSVTLTITDDDPPPPDPTVRLSVSPSEVLEGRSATITATLSEPAPGAMDIPLRVRGGTAERTDYDGTPTIRVRAGSDTGAASINTRRDTDVENETLVIRISVNDLQYDFVAGSPSEVTIHIRDADVPAVAFARSSARVGEAEGTHQVRLNLSHGPQANLDVHYRVNGTATSGSDYTALSGTLSVPQGATAAMIPVTITDDGNDERDETLILHLSIGNDYRLGSPSIHTLTIVDNDQVVGMIAAVDAAVTSLEKVKLGLQGRNGGFTAAECRSEATRLGVLSWWSPWCSEIARQN